MRPRPFFTLAVALALLAAMPGPAAAASVASESRQTAAIWLSGQLHRPVDASQILVSPRGAALEDCTITRLRYAATGATALSLRCPTLALPQLVLLQLPADAAASDSGPTVQDNPPSALRRRGPLSALEDGSPRINGAPIRAPMKARIKAAPLVRAGAALRADWRTPTLHAQLPVVALDAGASGAEIRVRIVNTNRILRARILSAQAVAIVVAGA
jgi:hypothetical protein